jgi:Mrp family chromosome partitioning ATPase
VAEVEHPTGTIPRPPAERRAVHPRWEVDRFQWPAPVDRLVGEFSELLNGILDRLLVRSLQGTPRRAVTGYARGEGRTTLTLALARLAARRGCSVVVVDGDHEHPQLAQQLGLSFARGWDEQGSSAEELAEVAIHSLEDNMAVLPLRNASRPNPLDRHGAARMLNCLASTYDLLLVDAGPMFTAVRYWFEGQMDRAVDSALVVRGADTVSDTQLADVVQRLSSRHVPIVGIVENFSVTQPIAATKLAS